jgi:hypothetical protein
MIAEKIIPEHSKTIPGDFAEQIEAPVGSRFRTLSV